MTFQILALKIREIHFSFHQRPVSSEADDRIFRFFSDFCFNVLPSVFVLFIWTQFVSSHPSFSFCSFLNYLLYLFVLCKARYMTQIGSFSDLEKLLENLVVIQWRRVRTFSSVILFVFAHRPCIQPLLMHQVYWSSWYEVEIFVWCRSRQL